MVRCPVVMKKHEANSERDMTRIRYIEPVDSDLYHESRTAFMNKIVLISR